MAEINDQNSGKPVEKLLKSPHAEREERILAYWKDKGIFEKSLNKEAPNGHYTFYDGPPFATGTPHFGHILAGTIKDVIPRWKTMQGYNVRRRWGWDCHGLPVENLVEKELGLKSKKDIIDYGIGKFNAVARESVMRYADIWKEIIPRLGRWVDMDNDYRTMDATYTESVWWIFKNLYDKNLIYEGFKSMNLCPHCGTTLSNFEVAQGYKDITDISVYVKFKIKETRDRRQEAGEKEEFTETYLLAWTTTPWTLPGNVALAVNPKIEYVKIKISEGDEQKRGLFILAKERLIVLKDIKYEVLETIPASKLIGMPYEPLFDYYAEDATLKDAENGWKIYGADFVTTEDGTGIVHIAPAFGADDYEMLKSHGLPFVQHVSADGKFKNEVTDFAGMNVKPKDTEEDKNAHQKTDIEVIKWLAHNGKLFEKEKLVHSYPHCWRCETPLLNYAASSWFVKVTDLKDKLVAENKKITWVPPEVGSARFGNWLEGARDWAISRSRFWGAPIPVWREENTDKYHVIGSIEDIKRFSKPKNNYYVMRHGEAENNVKNLLNSDPTVEFKLTDNGKEEVLVSSKSFNVKPDLIFSSPFPRTMETANIIAEAKGIGKQSIIVDDRLKEIQFGELDNQIDSYSKLFQNREDYFTKSARGVENRNSIKRRVGSLLYDLENKYQGKNILIVGHDGPLWMMGAVARNLNINQTLALKPRGELYLKNAEIRKLDFYILPHNIEYELDLHRPYIDELELQTPEGNKLKRVPDVFDCWYESGSMPYGESHYPFGKTEAGNDFDPTSGLFHKSKGYPADFIAEGLDQTRGWFYSMLVLGVALFGKTPYKKVIVNGLVLAEDGEKMSKSKKNFPDPMTIVDKYGADSLRLYLMSSPVVHGQDLCFSEKGVDEITKKVVNRLLNVVSFYELYAEVKSENQKAHPPRLAGGHGGRAKVESQNILDRWILARLNELTAAVTDGLEKGELDRAARPFLDFTDDLSTWYLRRSRDRFKGDDETDKDQALMTTRFVLIETVKLLAPFMPFLAEDVYLRLGGESESVHLEDWPGLGLIDQDVLSGMQFVRAFSTMALMKRNEYKINVRQPLSRLSLKNDGAAPKYWDELKGILMDEVNVKEIVFDNSIVGSVELEKEITPELKEEGMVRELTRAIQDYRKELKLSPSDKVVLGIQTDEAGKKFIQKNRDEVVRATSLTNIEFKEIEGGKEFGLGEYRLKFSI